MNKKSFSVVIPVYMNAPSLYETYIKIMSVIRPIEDKYNYELLFINDGSSDNSLDELLKIKKCDANVKIIDLTRNFGQVSAIYAGFEHTESDFIINISADLQDSPSYFLKMIKKWEEGYKVVVCKRASRNDGFFSKFVSLVFYKLINSFVNDMPKGGFDYFLLDKIVYKGMVSLNERNSFMQGDILWFGYKPYFIEYRRAERKYGKSQWTLAKKMKYFIDGVFNTSYLPIRMASFLGLGIATVGFIYSVLVVFAWMFKKTPFSGYTPIMMVLLIFFGLIMIILGIIGEYIWRIYDEVKKRPKFIVRNIY